MEKVMVGWPSGGSVHTLFTKALLDLYTYELENESDEYVIHSFEQSSGLYVQNNRNELVRKLLASDADWLLQIDGDESFQPHILRLLMRHSDSEAKIISGIYSNVSAMGQNTGDGGVEIINCIYVEAENGQYLPVEPPKSMKLFEIAAAGTGIILIHRSVFEAMFDPWFWIELFENLDGTQQFMNEDIAFCRKARDAGFSIWCDPMVEVMHWKNLPLMPSTVRTYLKEADSVLVDLKKNQRQKPSSRIRTK